MARRKRGAKKQAVLEMIAQHPQAKTSELVKLLADKKIKVSHNYVYSLKTVGKIKKAKAKRQKAIAASNGVGDPVALIQSVKDLAAQAGGMSKLKALVEILE